MLSKLLKYELKATSRILLPLYAVLLVFSAVNRLISSVSANRWEAPEIISLIVCIIILAGTFVMTYVVMIQRFYKNLLSDEGYLMFTLPTRSWEHIVSKLLISMMWMVASAVAAFISIIIIVSGNISVGNFWVAAFDAINQFYSFWGGSAPLFTLEIIVWGVVSLASGVLIIYASIAIGHLFNSHRVLASLGAFLGLTTVSQTLFAIAGGLPVGLVMPQHMESIEELRKVASTIHIMAWYLIALFAVLSAGYFFVTNYILSKRLNLE